MTPEDFLPHVGTPFSIPVEGGEPLVLTLDEVAVRGDPRPFSLLFSGPADRMAPQGTLTLAHDELGHVVLFVVPIGPGRYESLFN